LWGADAAGDHVGVARRVRWLRRGAIVATVAAVLAGLAVSSAAHATAFKQVFLQLNLCGNACNAGALGVVSALEDTIGRRRPFAVTLNELCENQYERLRADLDGYQGRFDPTGPRCRNGARYGNAILVRAPDLTVIGSWPLPNPAADELRRLMCLSAVLPWGKPLVLCVTHISNEAGNIAAQVRATAGVLNGLTRDHVVLLGGDFNTDPADARLSPLYLSCTGAFREADSTGCPARAGYRQTYPGHKYDYLFLSNGDWSAAAETDAAGGLSDHHALWATATLLLP
jgi:endonuclease/exonuclease/phosphatase family metal-dependent hydrolase